MCINLSAIVVSLYLWLYLIYVYAWGHLVDNKIQHHLQLFRNSCNNLMRWFYMYVCISSDEIVKENFPCHLLKHVFKERMTKSLLVLEPVTLQSICWYCVWNIVVGKQKKMFTSSIHFYVSSNKNIPSSSLNKDRLEFWDV